MRSIKAVEKNELVPAVAAAIDATNTDVAPGLYVFAADLWRMEGVRKQTTIQHIVLSVKSGQRLDSRIAEQLIDRVCQYGKHVDMAEFAAVQTTLINALRACEQGIEEDYLSEMAAFEAENTNRVTQAHQLVDARANRKLEQLRAILDQQMNLRDERQRRVIPLTEARIRRAQDEREKQVARIERQGRVESSFRPIVGGLIVVNPE
jgi:hypothetical protein